MTKSNQSALARHRRRLKARGVARLEVRVGRTDVELVRSVVDALTDPRRDVEARALLRRHFAPPPAGSLKALLASAPLDGVDLSRDRDLPREIEAWPS
jgi:hypothetical protein